MSERRYPSADVEWIGMEGRFLDGLGKVRIEAAAHEMQNMGGYLDARENAHVANIM